MFIVRSFWRDFSHGYIVIYLNYEHELVYPISHKYVGHPCKRIKNISRDQMFSRTINFKWTFIDTNNGIKKNQILIKKSLLYVIYPTYEH